MTFFRLIDLRECGQHVGMVLAQATVTKAPGQPYMVHLTAWAQEQWPARLAMPFSSLPEPLQAAVRDGFVSLYKQHGEAA